MESVGFEVETVREVAELAAQTVAPGEILEFMSRYELE